MQNNTSVVMLNTSLIIPNKYQPRKVFDEVGLNKLAESIKVYGIINPILVRKKDDKYEIIAGERRFRAAQKLGLTEVPVVVKSADEQQMAELALIENIQRQGLSSIEEAKSYEEIMRIGNQTQASLAQKIGKSQSSIANKIRLLSLPQEIQEAIANQKISERHGRSLLSVANKDKQLELLNKIITERLTVKETEQLINTKEIDKDEIKQAISDIMKSLNIQEDKEEEKEDDNMNNGNFFPNFDNNNAANNNASLNMMNMQSMNQAPVAPEPEVVMPTMAPPVAEPQLVVPTPQPMMQEPAIQAQPMPILDQFGPQPVPMATPDLNMNNNMNSMPLPQDNLAVPAMPAVETPMINDAPLFGPQPMPTEPTAPVEPVQPMSVPMMDEPLFNPNLAMPSQEPVMPAPMMQEPAPIEQPTMAPQPFEVPVSAPQPMMQEPAMPVASNQLTVLQEFLNANGYAYKTYGNESTDCIIIELPRN